MKGLSPNSHGAAAVEFALVLPLLLTILFGTIEWGYYFFNRQIVINSAREGARVGTLQSMQDSDAVKAAQDYLIGSGLVLKTGGGTVGGTVFTSPSAGTCSATSSCIRVEYTLPSMTGFLDAFLGKPRTIVAYAEMRK